MTTQPSLVAKMVDALGLTGTERVLEVGTGYGWQTALLARLAREVWSVERWPDLAQTARGNLSSHNTENAVVVVGDGSEGLAEQAPFDAILVSAAFPDVPEPLAQQLVAGGRLVQPIDRAGLKTSSCSIASPTASSSAGRSPARVSSAWSAAEAFLRSLKAVSEGDALHRAARRLQPLVGETLEVETPHPRAAATGVAERLDGRRLEGVEAIGKNLVLRFDGGLVLRSHLRMRGRWTVRERGASSRGRPWLVLRGGRGGGAVGRLGAGAE